MSIERNHEVSDWNKHKGWTDMNFIEIQSKQRKIKSLETLDTYQDVTSIQLSQEAYNKFELILSSCDISQHSEIISYIKESWTTLSQAELEGFILNLLGSNEDMEKQKILEESHKAFDRLAESVKGLNPAGKSYESVLLKINTLAESWFGADFQQKIQEILKDLEEPQVLLALSADIQEYDKQHGTSNFIILGRP